MKKLILPVLLVMVPFIILAQNSLTGKVTDRSTNEPLMGATIRLINTFHETVSNNLGVFSIKNLKPDTYSLVASYIGYLNDTAVIDLSKTTIIAMALIPSAIMQEEVIVLATRAGSKTPVAYQSIKNKEIADVNFGQDLPILLGNSISAVSTSDAGNGMGYTALRIRGTDMTRINVTINGIPLNDPESHNVYWVDLPDFATSTDNIQIQRGVGTSTNGVSAFGASINLQSAYLKNLPYAELNSAAGSFNSFKNTLSLGSGLLKKHFSLDARLSKISSDGFIDRASSDLLSYYISGAYIAKKDIVRFNIFSGKEKTYQAWDGVPSTILDTNRTYNGTGAYFDSHGNLQYYGNETDNYKQTHYQAIYSHEFSTKLILNTSVHHTVGGGYYEQYKESGDLADYGIVPDKEFSANYNSNSDTISPSSTDLVRQKHLANSFTGITWSLNYSFSRLRSSFGGSWNTYTGNHFGKVIWSEYTGTIEPGHEWYRSKALKNDFNIFVKTEFALTEKFSTWIDLQYRNIGYSIDGIDDDMRDITQDHEFNFFNPKLGISWQMTEKQNAYASVSVANREPNRDNFIDANPLQPVPQPETLYDAEAGYSFTASRFSINSNLYYMHYKDQLVLTGEINDVGAPVMINVPSSYRAGIEVAAKVILPGNLKWESSVTLSRNKIKSFTEYIDNWDTWGQIAVNHTNTDLAYSPAAIASGSLSWQATKGLTLSLIRKFVGKQFIDNTQSADRQLNSYFVDNLLVKYSIHPGFCKEIGFSLMINNLFNQEYESNAWVYRYSYENTMQKLDGYFPQAGINFMAGIVAKL
ncbi:MAG: TonB-dependent receptor [Bacteroidota bacterium]